MYLRANPVLASKQSQKNAKILEILNSGLQSALLYNKQVILSAYLGINTPF